MLRRASRNLACSNSNNETFGIDSYTALGVERILMLNKAEIGEQK